MKVKVIKGIVGLSEGDILDWNKDKEVFEIFKTDEETSEFYKSSSSTNYHLSNDIILEHSNNFIFITDEGKEVSITKQDSNIMFRIPSIIKEDIKEEAIKDNDIIDKLKKENSLLKKVIQNKSYFRINPFDEFPLYFWL